MLEPNNFFTPTLSQPLEEHPHEVQQMDWFFIISLLFVLLLAIIKLNFYYPFTSSYKELVKENPSKHAYNNDILQTSFLSLLLVVCTCIVFSLVFYVIFNPLYEQENISIFLWTFIMIMCFFFIRFLLLKSVGLLFNIRNIISEWVNLTTMLDFLSSVLCLPFVFIAYYYSFSWFLILPLIIFIGVFLIRCTRGWNIFKRGLRIYEYFLYLCTIEILPLLLLLKFVSNKLLMN